VRKSRIAIAAAVIVPALLLTEVLICRFGTDYSQPFAIPLVQLTARGNYLITWTEPTPLRGPLLRLLKVGQEPPHLIVELEGGYRQSPGHSASRLEVPATPVAQPRRYAASLPAPTNAVPLRYWITRPPTWLFGKRGPWKIRPIPTAAETFSFAVLGDSGTGSRAQRLVARAIAAARPDLIIHTGDLVYLTGQLGDYPERFFRPYAELITGIPFMPVVGNHDLVHKQGAGFEHVFLLPQNGPSGTQPERSYWFDFANARFAAVDTNASPDDLRRKVAPWLDSVFRNCPRKWKFVYMHHPPYSGCEKRTSNPKVRQILAPVLEQPGIDIVFCGHNHFYERTHPLRSGRIVPPSDGVVYVVTGAAGATLYPEKADSPDYIAAFCDSAHSFTLVRLNADRLVLQQIDTRGKVLDRWECRKDGHADPRPTRKITNRPLPP